MEVIYAEKSPRTRLSEVTYVPRAPAREYDYYVILCIDDVPLVLYIELLSRIVEFIGKTAIDRLLGPGAQVFFTLDEPIVGIEATYGQRIRPELNMASLSQYSVPLILHPRIWSKIKYSVEEYSAKTQYIDIVSPEFWDEMLEAMVSYAPSIMHRYIHQPLKALTENILSKEATWTYNYWKILWYRAMVHNSLYKTGLCYSDEIKKGQEEIKTIEPIDCFLDNMNTYSLLQGICNTREYLNIHIVLPPLREAIDYYKRNTSGNRYARLHPAIVSLFSLIPAIAYFKQRIDNNKVYTDISIYIHYDLQVPVNLLSTARKIINLIKDYIVDTITTYLKYHNNTRAIDRIAIRNSIKLIEYEDRLSSVKRGIIEKRIQREHMGCSIIMVRDAPKQFLHKLTSILYESSSLYYIYIPEEIRVHIERLAKLIKQCINIDNLTTMPSTGIVPVFCETVPTSFLEKLREEKVIYKHLRDCSNARNFGTIYDALLKSSLISTLELKKR